MVRPSGSGAAAKPKVIHAGTARSRERARRKAALALPAAPLPPPLPEIPDGSKWKRNLIAAGIAFVATSAIVAETTRVQGRKFHAAGTSSGDKGLVIQRIEPTVPEDTIHQRAMAPERGPPDEHLRVRISVEDANLRSGPSLDSPVVGLGDPIVTYKITQWQGRWFEIVPEQTATLGVNGPAWIRNDLLEPATN